MALASTAVGEIRWGGNNLNGALFNPARAGAGTDRTQQTAPHYSVTNLAVDAVTNTRVTSASAAAVDADIGNHWNIASGGAWTGGMYEVVSRTGSAFNLDRSPAAAGSVNGTGRLGGAMANLSAISIYAPAGVLWWARHPGAGNSYPGPISTSFSGTSSNYSKLIGYGSTRGDGVKVPVGWVSGTDNWIIWGERLVVANFLVNNGGGSGSGALHGFNVVGGFNIFDNIESYGGSNPLENSGFRNLFRRCTFRDPLWAGSACAALGSVGGNNNQGVLFEFCTFSGGLDAAVLIGDGGFYVFNNCQMVESLYGISGSGRFGFHARNCTIARNSSHGWRNHTTDANAILQNLSIQRCLFGRNGGYDIASTGLDLSAHTDWAAQAFRQNAFYTTGTGRLFQFPASPDDVILSADPWTDALNSDYTINNVAGGGMYLRDNPPTVAFET